MSDVKIPNNLFELHEVQLLESYEHGNTMVIVWLKLIAKSRRIKNRRFVWQVANGVELTDKTLSYLFRIDKDVCKQVFHVLDELKFIEKNTTYIEVFRIWEGEQRNRNTTEYRLWRESVFIRDNYTCQECGTRGAKLNAHHVITWSDSKEERFNIENGITLCERCHKKLHKRGE